MSAVSPQRLSARDRAARVARQLRCVQDGAHDATRTLSVDVKRESEYFAEQSEALTRVLSIIAYVVGGIMAVGALFGALNTMYSAVSARAGDRDACARSASAPRRW